MYSVYIITNRANGKRYVGQSASPADRFRKHVTIASRGEGYVLHAAIRRYGAEAFRFEVLRSELSKIEADECERQFIREFQTRTTEWGYNCTDGGEGAFNLSDEARARIAAGRKGKKASPETRARLVQSHLGKHPSPEAYANIVAANRGAVADAKRGKARSPETIAKISAARRGKPLSPEHKAKLRAVKISDATRALMSAAQKRRWASIKAAQQGDV